MEETIANATTAASLPGDGEEVGCVVEEYDYYNPTDKWLLGVVVLPFIAVGLLANLMSVLIFSHRHMRQQPVNWYLLILAISDSVILLCAFCVLTLPRLGELLAYWDATRLSYYSTPYMYAFMTLAQTISVWMTAAMSMHRFIGVCLPYRSAMLLRRANVKRFICVVVLASMLFNTSKFFEVRVGGLCFVRPIGAELPMLKPTDLRTNALYRKIFYEWAYTLVMFVVPFSILIIVNSMVIKAIHKSRQIHAKLNSDDAARKQELAKEIATSIMLVAIVLAFLMCNTLAFVVNIMEKLELTALYSQLVPWSNMLVMTNASVNICIYCMFSDKYRRLLCHYTRCCTKRFGKHSSSADLNNFQSTNLSGP